jgi:hypothetical protein
MSNSDFWHVVSFGSLLSAFAGGWIVLLLRINPRLFLRNYPKAIRAAVPPLTKSEKSRATLAALPLFACLIGVPVWSALNLAASRDYAVPQVGLFIDAFGVATVFNLVDLVLLDILWLGLFPPRWAMMPGAEGIPYQPEFAKHLRGFLVGTIIAAMIAGLASALIPHA